MSTTATFPAALAFDSTATDGGRKVPAARAPSLFARFKDQFYRFLERLPEKQDDVDRSFFKRPPMPF